MLSLYVHLLLCAVWIALYGQPVLHWARQMVVTFEPPPDTVKLHFRGHTFRQYSRETGLLCAQKKS